jgi:hypothetical protein
MIDDSSFAMERPRDATGAPVPTTPTVGGLGGVLDRGDEGGVGGMLSPACCGDAEVKIVLNQGRSKDSTNDGIPATGELSGNYGEHFGDQLTRICRNDMEIPPSA